MGIKFVNRFVPKVSLATSVLSHALADLLLFGTVFVWSIAAFAQLFYMQLGPYMRGYSSLMLAMLTLFRSLFGDFDIQAIVDSSNSYLNMFFFLGYLFFAVFILLSIFLPILGEHQDALQTENAERQQALVRKGQPEIDEWGVLGTAKKTVHFAMARFAKTKAFKKLDKLWFWEDLSSNKDLVALISHETVEQKAFDKEAERHRASGSPGVGMGWLMADG